MTAARPAPPDLRDVERWTRRAVRRRRRLTHSASEDLTDLYTALLGVAVIGAMTAQALSGLAPSDATPGQDVLPPAVASLVARTNPVWPANAGVLLLASAAAGQLRRLGPVFLRPEQTVWWLPLPGGRRTLLARIVRRQIGVAALLAVAVGIVLAALGGTGAPGVLPWALLCLGACAATVVGLASAQLRGRGTAGVRALLLFPATACALATPLVPAGAVDPRLPPALVGAGLLVAAAVQWFAAVRPRLEGLDDAALLESGHRAFGLQVSALSMDTRAVGRLLSAPPLRPRRSAPLRAARLGARLPATARCVLGVAQADWLLLVRQPWRIARVGVSGLLTTALLIPGLPRLSVAAVVLVGGWTAVLALAEPARQAAFDGAPDERWPVGPAWVRIGHLLVPTVCMSGWCVMLWDVLVASGVGAGAGAAAELLLMVECSAPGWAGVALRSGFRPTPSWSMIIPTPFGAIPSGLVESLLAGPDAAVLVALPIITVAAGGALTPMTPLVQAGASVVVILWSLRIGRSRSG